MGEIFYENELDDQEVAREGVYCDICGYLHVPSCYESQFGEDDE